MYPNRFSHADRQSGHNINIWTEMYDTAALSFQLVVTSLVNSGKDNFSKGWSLNSTKLWYFMWMVDLAAQWHGSLVFTISLFSLIFYLFSFRLRSAVLKRLLHQPNHHPGLNSFFSKTKLFYFFRSMMDQMAKRVAMNSEVPSSRTRLYP